MIYCEVPGCNDPAERRIVVHVQQHKVVLHMCEKCYAGRAKL